MTTSYRIVHFVSSTGHGGDALHVLELARAQREIGYDARIVLGQSEFSSRYAERASSAGVPCHVEAALPLDGSASLRRIGTFRRVLGAERPTVLHLHSGALAIRAVDVVGARMVPASLRVATLQWPLPWPAGSEDQQRRWRQLSTLLHKVTAPSKLAVRYQTDAGIPANRLSILGNAVNTERMEQGDGARVRRELGLTPDALVVVFLARLDRQKRPTLAVRVFLQNCEAFPNARMLVAGIGEEEPSCRAAVAASLFGDRVQFLGYRTDVADVLAAADVYVLPTESESFGISLVEAMAAGAPLITTDAPPVRGEVIPDDAAEFVPVDDEPALAAAMRRLLADPRRRAELAERGREVARQHSGVEVARRHIAFYDELMA